VVKAGAPQPFRLIDLAVAPHDRLVLSGLDADAAELFVHLVTGAAVPDEGEVLIAGRDTRAIATDTEWLASLDRFGIVTRRAVLLESMSVAANLALPLTLSIDPIAPDIRARLDAEGAAVGLLAGTLDGAASALGRADRLRLHLARAVIGGPALVLLEHPTSELGDASESAAFGATLDAYSTSRGFGWIAISDDVAFAKAARGKRLRIDSRTGRVSARRWALW
jgi:ABC-type lipoprotein export system ATPase subunit